MAKTYLKMVYLWFLRLLAQSEMKKHPDTLVIGITGSAGKTSCKDTLIAFLEPHYQTRLKYTKKGRSFLSIPFEILNIPVRNYSFLQYGIVLFQAIWNYLFLKQEFDIFIVEYDVEGPDQPYNMEYLLTLVTPDIAILLPVSGLQAGPITQHAGSHLSIQKKTAELEKAVIREKMKLLYAVKNKKRAYITRQITKILDEKEYAGMTILGEQAAFILNGWKNTSTGCAIACTVQDKEYKVALPNVVLSKALQIHIEFSAYVTLLLKKDLAQSFASLKENFHLEPGRASLLPGLKGTVIIDSSFNASTLAATELFGIVDEIAKKENRKRIIVLGDFKRVAVDIERTHAAIVTEAAKHADILILTNELMKEHGIPAAEEAGFVLNENLFWLKNGKQLSYHIAELVEDEALVLFEGSQHGVYLEYAVYELLANKDEGYVKTHLARIGGNWKRLKHRV